MIKQQRFWHAAATREQFGYEYLYGATDRCQLADTAVAAALDRYVMASSLPPDPGSVRGDTWQRGELLGRWAQGKVHGITHDTPGRGPWKSRWYIWKVHVDGMGWEGEWRWGKEPVLSHTRSLPISLSCRRDTGLSHCPPQPYPASTQMDVGKSVPWPAKAGPVGRGGQSAKPRSPASFCKWHGGSLVRLRAVGEAKYVIVRPAAPLLAKVGISPRYGRQMWLGGLLPC